MKRIAETKFIVSNYKNKTSAINIKKQNYGTVNRSFSLKKIITRTLYL